GGASAHAGGEVAAGRPEHYDESVGHVLAAVVAHAFNNRSGAGIANREALAADAVEEGFATGRAVERDVPHENAFLGQERRSLGRIDDEAAAGKAFAQVIVCVPFQLKRDAVGHECAEALTRGAIE